MGSCFTKESNTIIYENPLIQTDLQKTEIRVEVIKHLNYMIEYYKGLVPDQQKSFLEQNFDLFETHFQIPEKELGILGNLHWMLLNDPLAYLCIDY